MNTIKQSVAITALTHAITDKSLHIGVKAFINDCKSASMDDLTTLLTRIMHGKERLTRIYKDCRDRWHFVTAW